MTPSAAGHEPLLILTGTTASGKNQVAVLLAEGLSGEIISLDSMKVYRGMDVGTDKPGDELRARVRHHLVDVIEPRESMNLRRFVELAHAAREEIRARDRLPVAVGGTALYLTGFLRGVFAGPGADPEFRRGLRAEAVVCGVPTLHARLAAIDAAAAQRIHPNDYKRIERALEVFALTGRRISDLQAQWSRPAADDYRLFVLTWDRSVLDRRIDERVDRMFDGGLVEEVERILGAGGFGSQAGQALGYREVIAALRGEITMAEARDMVKRGTRRYARRQLTWFRRMRDASWIEAGRGDGPEEIAGRVRAAYGAAARA